MKRFVILCLLIVCPFMATSWAQSNREARVAYVLKNLGISKDQQKKLRPMLFSYLEEKKKAGEAYDALKDKYKQKIEKEKLSDAQADELLNAKWAADSKEAAVKKTYTAKFKTVISAKKVWKCFDLLNDKKSKVTGKKKSEDSEDDD